MNNNTSYGLPLTSAQCKIGAKRYPDAAILIYLKDDIYSQRHGQNKETFRVLTKNDMLKPYISDHEVRSTSVINAGEDDNTVRYNLYDFGRRFLKNLEGAQPIKVEFEFSEDAPAGIYGYALVVANKLVNMSSDGLRQFDLN